MEDTSHHRSLTDMVSASIAGCNGGWDETRAEDGALRPVWNRYLEALGGLGPGDISLRWEEARRILRDNGVSHNVYADPRGADRPWQLDAIPQPMEEAEWRELASGIAQRARLLEALLADVYGPQRAILEGVLPASLVYANSSYLRPLQGARPKGGRWLHLYSCELARGPDGRWLVLADRTQSPAGAGYVLENRVVLSRAFPEAYRAARVQRLAPHFARMRRMLRALAGHENPHVVLLTPGPFGETYFEHAYLSRYLGFTLAEGGDLAVRDERVYLKTLGGLRPVDVILRHMDDDFCDPLELRGDSVLGTSGLVQAVRSGNVAVANVLGSGIAESAGLLAYLPDLCRLYLGEELALPSVETVWCGEKEGLKRATLGLADMVAKPAQPSSTAAPVFGDRLGEHGRQIMSARMAREPDSWIAQRIVPVSNTAVWTGKELGTRPMSLRLFACRDGDGFDVLPGGLVRVGSLHAGGGSKDLWVMGEAPVAEVSLLRTGTRSDEFRRSGTDLPSRVAENLFWLGRYAERIEGIVRLSRATLGRLSGESTAAEAGELGVLMASMRGLGLLASTPPSGRFGIEGAEREVIGSVFLSGEGMGLQQTLAALHQAGFHVRDRISNDTWRILHHLGRDFAPGRRHGSSTVGDVLSVLDNLLLHLSALAGMSKENTTRGSGWRFLDLGRRLERSQFTVDMLCIVQNASKDGLLGIDALLEVFDSGITYRSRYLTELQFAQAVDLLLVDEDNPRSLLFQLSVAKRHLDALPKAPDDPFPRREQALVLRAVSDLRLLDFPALARDPEGAERARLGDLLERLRGEIPEVSDCLTRTWLSHAETTRQLSRAGG